MIEQDAVRGVETIGIAIVHRCPVSIKLGGCIWAARSERRLLVLRMVGTIAEKLRSGSLIETAAFAETQDAHGFKQAQCAERIGIGRIFRRFKTHLHMALGAEIINLVRLHFLDDAAQIGCVCQVAEMQAKADVFLMRVLIKMVDTRRIE
ncbi:Uncharacterised protein [Brucella suis]|nr:Uncharacterised protein [Brucella suis]